MGGVCVASLRVLEGKYLTVRSRSRRIHHIRFPSSNMTSRCTHPSSTCKKYHLKEKAVLKQNLNILLWMPLLAINQWVIFGIFQTIQFYICIKVFPMQISRKISCNGSNLFDTSLLKNRIIFVADKVLFIIC